MSSPFDKWTNAVQTKGEQLRLDFIRTDLELCLTFARIAGTAYGMGHLEHAERSLSRAEKGYSDMLRLFSQAKNITAEQEKELRLMFNRVRERLDGLQQRI